MENSNQEGCRCNIEMVLCETLQLYRMMLVSESKTNRREVLLNPNAFIANVSE